MEVNGEPGNVTATDPGKSITATIGNTISSISGATLRIRCPVSGSDDVGLRWMKNDQEISDDPMFVQDEKDRSLIIPKMSEVSEGGCGNSGQVILVNPLFPK